MTDAAMDARTTRSRYVGVAVTLVIGALVVLLAVLFANAQSVQFVADEGIGAVNAEAVVSSASVVRNRAVQALVIATAEQVGAALPPLSAPGGDVAQWIRACLSPSSWRSRARCWRPGS